MSILLAVLLLTKLVFWAMLVVSGVWAYHRFRLRSLLCLGIVLVIILLSFPADVLEGKAIDNMGASVTALHWSKGQFIINWGYLKTAVEDIVKVILALIVIGDIALLLSKLGVPLVGKVFQNLLRIQRKGFVLSAMAVALALAVPLGKVALYLYYT